MQNRWKSKAAWLSLLPIIILLGNAYGLWNIINMDAGSFEKLFLAIVAAAAAFGIFNNPTDKDNF